ncbi:MAG: hypothetical protein RJA70_3182 [Pseudomonadota bacterium]|jgi:serine/threonine-protein kinase
MLAGVEHSRSTENPTSTPTPEEVNSIPFVAAAKRVVSVGSWDQQAAVRAAANRELHPELLGPAVTKLRDIASVATLCLALVLVGGTYLRTSIGAHRSHPSPLALGALIGALGASLGLVAAAYAGRKRPAVVHDLGHLYLVALCFLLGLFRHSEPWPSAHVALQVSPMVVPVLAFAALIPAPLRTARLVFLAAAVSDPLAYFLVTTRQAAPSLAELLWLMAPQVIASAVAYRISRTVHRLSEGAAKALEVGSYRLVERLGVGGMAEVWRADHRMLARPAAIKLIRPKVLLQHDPKDLERLLRIFAKEARATASLRSPHTIQVYDFGLTREGAFFYVMELLDGLDLRTLVERFGRQPAERAAALMMQVCHSLAEAHDRNFVHRDVKPANIFLCHWGNDYDFVKVLDFGLVMDTHPTADELEDEQRLVGTPLVMAPEMVRFKAPVDARADLYALGCVGYWLLTAQPVFEAITRHDILVMHAHQKPVTPSKRIDGDVHLGLEALIMSCLEKNPNKRPQSANELKAALAALKFDREWTPERANAWWQENWKSA